MTRKSRYFWPMLLVLFTADCTTKDLIVNHLDPAPSTRSVLDSYVRLTLVHNPGTAFGLDVRPYLGAWSRPILTLGMVAVLIILLGLYRNAAPQARLVAIALGLACGGAMGNILDRIRFPLGVVDFIDVGVGPRRFWTFNVADAGITIGAFILAAVLMREPHPIDSRSLAAN